MPKQKTAPPAELPVKFTGGSNYLTGLPTRDMSLNAWLAHPLELRAVALKLGLYTLAETDDPEAFAKVAALRLAETPMQNGSPTSIDSLGLTLETEEGEA